MSPSNQILIKRNKLLNQYRTIIEEAYNWRQIDQAQSDLLEFKALKTLNKLNKLNFLEREIGLQDTVSSVA